MRRTKLDHGGDAQLRHYCQAGIPAPEASRRLQAMGYQISPATVGRRYTEIRGNVRASSKASKLMRPQAAPVPVARVQSPEDAERLVELLSATEPDDEPMVPWLADLLAVEVADGCDVAFAQLPAMLVACLTDPEHVRRALATLALISTDDGDDDDTREAHIARARGLLVSASAELATVHATHFAEETDQ